MSKNIGDQLVSAQEATRARLRAMIFAGECREHCAYTARGLVNLLRAARPDQPSDPKAA
jgi:hypothetical protein